MTRKVDGTGSVSFAAPCIPLLRGINIDTFARDVAAESARRSAAAMGWTLPASPGDARR